MFYTSRLLRSGFLATLVALTAACPKSDGPSLSQSEKAAIADSVRRTVVAAYDLRKPDVVASMMSLYPPTGRVISAASGSATKTRAELEAQIKSFWDRVGKNMQSPKWEWTSMDFDVLSRTSAVMTATYRVPHLTPMEQPHVIGGAWTAVFQLQNGRWVIVQEHLSDSPTP
ncbi:MAG: nuclear transport factor 2 family protein [Gemmatimonadaceae bacterium]|nr:nuclear transport factor 2 family protein [Gemmatimonadaceae bacterium]